MRKLMVTEDKLENIRLQLEHLTGITKVCAVAYDCSDSYGSISEEETADAFYSINAQLKEINDEVDSLIQIVLHDIAEAIHEKESQTC